MKYLFTDHSKEVPLRQFGFVLADVMFVLSLFVPHD